MPARLIRTAPMDGPHFAAVVVLSGLLYVAWDQANHNFGEVQHGRIYRSGQMPASALARTIRDHEIKTVLNLRGSNKDSWYVAERAATLEAGATQIDIAMSSCIWMSRAQLRTADRDARHGRVPDADPLPVGGRAHRAWSRRSPSCSGRGARSTTRAPSSRSATCSSGSTTARSWPSTSTSTSTGSPSRRCDARPGAFPAVGRRGISARRSPTASNGLTIPIRWSWSPGRAPNARTLPRSGPVSAKSSRPGPARARGRGSWEGVRHP